MIAIVYFSTTTILFGQTNCESKPNFDSWLNCRVSALVVAKMNQRGNTQQAETPSLAGSSTSLVDQSAAPDLGAIAMNLLSPGSRSGDTKTASGTITTSLYALYAAVQKHNALDPAFYNSGTNWRRVSFTFGREYPDDDKASTSQRATLIGGKVLLLNYRDASAQGNQADIRSVSSTLKDTSPNYSKITREVQDYLQVTLGPALGGPSLMDFLDKNLATNFGPTIRLLNDQQLAQVDKIISERLEPEIRLHSTVLKVLQKIRRKPQLAFAFTTKQRSSIANNEYQPELTFDWGIEDRLNWTMNGSLLYIDSPNFGRDQRGGRFSNQFQYQVTREQLTGRNPVTFSVAFDAKGMTKTVPTYVGQLKVSIPIAAGVDFPLSVSFASRTDLVKESSVKGRFGFTFDFAKLAAALK
jgi:hypothetical protein